MAKHRLTTVRLLGICVVLASLSSCVGYMRQYQAPEQRNEYHADKPKVRASFGEPSKIVSTAGGEIWEYELGTEWCGVFLSVIIIPIPLALPTCSNRIIVEFQGQSTVAMTTLAIRRDAHYFGLFADYDRDVH